MSLISGGSGTLGKTTIRLKALHFSFRKQNWVEIEVNENSECEAVLFKIAFNFFFKFINEIE